MGYVAWFAATSLYERKEDAQTLARERAALTAHHRKCVSAMSVRNAELEADRAVAAADYRPLIVYIGDDVGRYEAVGMPGCRASNAHASGLKLVREPEPCSQASAYSLAGPHPAILAFAERYNRRLLAIAPEESASFC
ncbi:hypothetical protein [Sphingosinicella sp. LY1275]|uniref:hypothetical protein n=1 Tax=Sphingosinicella sp. LY1275 TaxID=3095379 RepID=UPI002ADEDEA1|nr:hypothetical protein [Sphingosinicella sp. LY1275]MEA1013303.1 hypothetical protein [Sphingosinicella sp. LY1275]